ncbi:gluconate 2-dehydrogenase subunit 3 family protein [Spirosoma validum]|uniref:Gluconate 2-dehydrogenase subunit 3 family protein n=1 Tax=Spirosoma validum TaxID=2771355 RepID=A0A927B0Y8_9BACT|nr:gluconate 2-dehydrogenase subunit 3 family protein [Spirosoma validum]MBD2753374.1 gluconate 2-dehydrogenase subunit 3 family protein [Spirosoma validum]
MKFIQASNGPFIARREALQWLAMLVGGTLSLPVQAALRGETSNQTSFHLSAEQQALIADLADVIIPTTDTPGAKAAGADQFIEYVIRNCSDVKQQDLFRQGLQQTNVLSQNAFGKPFPELSSQQRNEIVGQLTQREKPFFMSLRELTIVGYFTSETGVTKALDYLPIPGRFQGDVPFKAGKKVWAI